MFIRINLIKREPLNDTTISCDEQSSLYNSSGYVSSESSIAEQNERLINILKEKFREINMQHKQVAASSIPKRNPITFNEQMSSLLSPDDHSFKTAAYTVGLMVLVFVCFIGLWAIHHLLQPFLSPMMWAMLIGTVLFPVKQSIAVTGRSWLKSLRYSSTPLLLGIVLVPIKFLDTVGEHLWTIFTVPIKLCIVFATYTAIKALTYERTFVQLLGHLTDFTIFVDRVLVFLSCKWVLMAGALYLAGFLAWLYLSGDKLDKKFARVLSLPVWIIVLALVSDCFAFFRVPVFCICVIVLSLIAADKIHYPVEKEADTTVEDKENIKKEPTEPQVAELDVTEAAMKGDTYLQMIFIACIILFAAKNSWVLTLFLPPFLYTAIKKSGILQMASGVASQHLSVVFGKIKQIIDICVPHTMRNFVKLVFSSDQQVIISLEGLMDLIASILVIIGVVISIVLVSIFVVMQIHAETAQIVKLTGRILDEVQEDGHEWMAAAVNYTDNKFGDDMDDYVEKGYKEARQWIGAQARSLVNADPERADDLEKQVLSIVDRLYELYQTRITHNQGNAIPEHDSNEQDIWTHLTAATDLTALRQHIQEIIQENVSTLMTIAESVWSLLSANITFISGLFGALLGLVLSFGMELLNFIIETVVFFTMLYYLLASSGLQYKPMELFSSFEHFAPSNGGMSVSHAFEEAISGVFLLSGKMSVFYGLYTWFIHTLFGLNIVFVPSITASVLAAVPLTAPFWVCLLGVLELWLVSGEPGAALVFFLLSLAPMMFVDATFYKQLRSSHPYVTGLSIVGGMYWLGLQGAIIGPIILCCVIVFMQILRTTLGNGGSSSVTTPKAF